ncbi:MAG: cache domain-containing protein [Candidatus Latescibacterota bacterium]
MKGLNFSSLRARLLLLIILASMPATVLIINHAAEERSAAKARVQADTLQLTHLAVSNQEQWIEGSRQLLIALGSLPAVRNRDGAEASEFFAEIHKECPSYANIFAATPDGDLFSSAIPLKQPVNSADLTWFKRAVSSRDFAISDYQAVGRITGVAVIVAAYPVYDEEGNLQAIVCASLDLTWLNEQPKKMQLPPDTSFRVIDQNGTILARHPEPEEWVGQSLPEEGITKTILSQHEGTSEAPDADNVTRFFCLCSCP